jgi:DNA-binding XRE family transcriptional regulator
MKSEQHQQAKDLYFQTNLSKTEIANRIGVNRRTIMLWSHQGNWDRLKKSAQHLPSLVAEKCYYLIDHFTSHLLSTHGSMSSLTNKDAETIYRLASSIKKLKNRSTTNESMEMFNFFLEGLKKKKPEMAEELMPLVEEYMESRKDINMPDFLLDGFNSEGLIPYPEKEIMEKWQDEKDAAAINDEFLEFSARNGATLAHTGGENANQSTPAQKDDSILAMEFQQFVDSYDTAPVIKNSLDDTSSSTLGQAA